MPKLTVGYLYPSVMCHYGDRGNLICLTKRCEWRGIEIEVQHLERGDAVDPDRVDLFLMGGGADSHQRLIADDMVNGKGEAVKTSIEDGAAALMVCGGYQLWGEFYRAYDGTELPGLGLFPSYTIHRAAQLGSRLRSISDARAVRSLGNLAVQWEDRTLIGFENHGGRTYLRPGAQALGRVLAGEGNNSEDGWEGCVYRNAIGTYLHGSLLPKNPALADHLIESALRRRDPAFRLEPLDDDLERTAHESVLQWVLEQSQAASRRGRARVKGRPVGRYADPTDRRSQPVLRVKP
jgi:CobQ-like glutamine amidotransferase family enzyme